MLYAFAAMLREHHAFRRGGRASRVEEAIDLVIAHVRVVDSRSAADERLVGDRSIARRAVRGVHHRADAGHLFAEMCGHTHEGVVDDDERRLAVSDLGEHLERREPDVQRHDHATCPRNRVVQLEVAVPVEHENGDAIAGLQAGGTERTGKPRHAVAYFPPRSPHRPVEHSRLVPPNQRGTPQSHRDLHEALPAGGKDTPSTPNSQLPTSKVNLKTALVRFARRPRHTKARSHEPYF
jgi:hypothetical protein